MISDETTAREDGEMRRRLAVMAIELSAEKAKLLTHEGMTVTVRTDQARIVQTRTRSRPWQLGHGAWVVLLEGFSGGYDCGRVTPVVPTPEEQKEAA